METIKLAVAILAVVLSLASFVVARRADARAKRAEAIKNLLGEKESVAFAGLKLLRDGLPKDAKERQLVLSSLMQACVFEKSARARAILYRVIERQRAIYAKELGEALGDLESIFEITNDYNFTREELNLSRGLRRLSAVKRVVEKQ